ncbi:unnamed protein product [Dicrocoelium dendriticum]|nr:unnamed protein product [Dicrocoelium dendriticum]
MLDICDRNAKNVINYFISYNRSGPTYVARRIFPAVDPEIYASRILEFGFSCCSMPNVSSVFKRGTVASTPSGCRVGERFVIVFTDAKGVMEFVFCHWPNNEVILCISSAFPWGSCFHSLLDIIWRNDLHLDSRWHVLQVLLSRLRSTLPPPRTIGYLSCPDPFNSSRILKFPIPTPRHPHNVKYLMEYYTALDASLWIHIFVCLILERSVLFYSKRFTRLTACVMTSVALLYPLQWVHSFYPLIPAKVLEVLGCPVPFVAGIHACNLQAALEHLNSGTCLVDLDAGHIQLFRSPNPLEHGLYDSFATPKAVYHFLRNELRRVQNQLNAALSPTKFHDSDWKMIDGEACSFLENLTQPFFLLLANLLGEFQTCDCCVGAIVALGSLLTRSFLEQPFTYLMSLLMPQCTSRFQFFDSRLRRPPDPNADAFESICWSLRASCKRHGSKRVSRNTGSPYPLTPQPIALTLNGSSLPRFQWTSDSSGKRRGGSAVNFGSEQWIRSKKIKHPGAPCFLDDAWTLAEDNKKVPSVSHGYWTKWSRKFRSDTCTLRNLSLSKDILPHKDSPSQTSIVTTSISNLRAHDDRRPQTHLSCTHGLSSVNHSAYTERSCPPELRDLGSPAPVPSTQRSRIAAVREPSTVRDIPSPSNFDDPAYSKPKPPRPPPPKTSHHTVSARSDGPLMAVSHSTQPEQVSSNRILGTTKGYTPDMRYPTPLLQAYADVPAPVVLPPRPKSCYFPDGLSMVRPVKGTYSDRLWKPTIGPTSVWDVAPTTPDPVFSLAADVRVTSSIALCTPSNNVDCSVGGTVPSRSRRLRRPLSQLFNQSSVGPVHSTDTSQLLLRRLRSLNERSLSIPAHTREVHTAATSLTANQKSPTRPACETGRVSRQCSDYENIPGVVDPRFTSKRYTRVYSIPSRPRTASLPIQPVLRDVTLRRQTTSVTNVPCTFELIRLADRRSNSAHNLATGDVIHLPHQNADAKTNFLPSSFEPSRKYATSPQHNEADTVLSSRLQWVCPANQTGTNRWPESESVHCSAPITMVESNSSLQTRREDETKGVNVA